MLRQRRCGAGEASVVTLTQCPSYNPVMRVWCPPELCVASGQGVSARLVLATTAAAAASSSSPGSY